MIRIPYPPVIQALIVLPLLVLPLSSITVLQRMLAAGEHTRFWLVVGLTGLHGMVLLLVPVRQLRPWQQLLFLATQCGLTVSGQIILPVPLFDYVYLVIVLQAIYLLRPWFWIPFASSVWFMWNGTILMVSASFIDWLQSNLMVLFPATCVIIAAIAYARQHRRYEQAHQMLQHLQQHYDTLTQQLHNTRQRIIQEERQRLIQAVAGELQSALLCAEQNIAAAINQTQTNLTRLQVTVAQTRAASSAAIEHLRTTVTMLRSGTLDLGKVTPGGMALARSCPSGSSPGRSDDLVLPAIPYKVLTWVLPLVFVICALPIILLESPSIPDRIWPALLFCALLMLIYALTQRIKHPLWVQAALVGQVVVVLFLVLLTHTLPLLLGMLLVIWQIALRLSAMQIIAFLAGVQTSTSVTILRLVPTNLEENTTNLLIFTIVGTVVVELLWMARHQLQCRHQDELRMKRLGELTGELDRQEAEARALILAAERIRMAHTLHDHLGHQLMLINLRLQLAEEFLQEDPAAALDYLIATRNHLRVAWQYVLVPPVTDYVIDGSTLPQSLRELVQQCRLATQVAITLQLDGDFMHISPGIADVLYAAVQEGLTNACKHAYVRAIQIVLHCSQQQVSLHIYNDDLRSSSSINNTMIPSMMQELARYGLIGLQERVEASGGTMTAGPHPMGGFGLDICLPLDTTKQ